MKYTVAQGCHDFSPVEIPWLYFNANRRVFSWEVAFDQSCRYTLPAKDQRDWNKGGGVSFHLLTNFENSLMWAWRYNPETDLIELGTYAHVNGERKLFEPRFMAHTGYKVKISMYQYDGHRWALEIGGSLGLLDFQTSTNFARRLGLWFGGNQAAPNRMEVFVNYGTTKL